MKIILLSILLLGIGIALIAIRTFFIKDGSFRGTCSGANAALREKGVVCSVCGAKPEEACKGNSERDGR